MPLPSPEGPQSEDKFVSSCMSSEKMKSEYPNQKQRYAVCKSQHKRSKKSKGGCQCWDDLETEDYILLY